MATEFVGGFSLRFDVAAGGSHTRHPSGKNNLRALMAAGAHDVVEAVLRRAGLDDRPWKVLVTRGFTNPDPHIPLLSGFMVDGRGVRFRFRPTTTQGAGWILLLCPHAMPAKDSDQHDLRDRLAQAAREYQGLAGPEPERSPPTAPEIVAQAVEAVRSLPTRWGDFNQFVKAVAEEAGPDEPFDYWKKALNAAADLGLLAHGSNCYVVAKNPDALKVPATGEPPVNLNGTHTPPKAPPAHQPAAAADPHLDDEALGMLTKGADAMLAHLERVKALGKRRKELLAERARVEAELAANTADIKAVANALPMNDLALASGVLGG